MPWRHCCGSTAHVVAGSWCATLGPSSAAHGQSPTSPAICSPSDAAARCATQIQQEKKYGKGNEYAVELGPLDYVKFAQAFGATGGWAQAAVQVGATSAAASRRTGVRHCCGCRQCRTVLPPAFTPACLCQTAGCCTRLAGIQINDADEFLPTLEKALEMQASSSWMDVRGRLVRLGTG